ncbi:FAD-dependent oxidoreductase [Streptomyces olivochromogenes]|uniref:FAD-dependent oxidoreductase n=1 Tax=Streptomyces olivochromogenes TaxID=1963 RepID=UPI0036D98016
MALWSQVLRSILMLGLEERIHYGKAAIGVTDIGDRAILAFADGTTAHAGQEPETLHAFARTLDADFHPVIHPVIRRMVRQGDPGSLIQTFMRAAQRPTTWTMPHVALLGDAAHLMPPFGAAGGNTALGDAAVLAEKLRTLPLTQALAAYREEMGAYAFKEVEASVKQMNRLTQTGQLAQWLMLRSMPRLHKRTV